MSHSQSPSTIQFGTDGWRAVIADEYTFDNVQRVARATAQWLHEDYGDAPSVVLGHDTRFLGPEFTEYVARVLAATGVQVTVAPAFASTPSVSWATHAKEADAGVVITASHNPPKYNGYKIKANFGGPAPPAMIAAVEGHIERLPEHSEPVPAFDALKAEGHIAVDDYVSAYLLALRERLDIDAIQSSGLTIAHDAMYGSAQGHVTRLLGADQVTELHHDLNPGFHGQAPEPIEQNLFELANVMADGACDMGLANDGDGDRVALFDEQGNYVSSHRILAVLVKYLYEERGLEGQVVKTFSTTHMLDTMCEAYGLPLKTTPIGFKYIADKMVTADILVGGEESGGIAAKGHIPERDGIYIGLLIAEMVVKRGKPLSALVQELYDEFGPHRTYRSDIHITDEQKRNVLTRLDDQGGLSEISGHAVDRVETLDGFKHITDGGWLLIRPSGTEPVLRVYSEAETAAAAKALVDDAAAQLELE